MTNLFAAINASDVNIPKITANADTFNAIIGIVYTLLAAFAIFYIVRGALLFITSGSDPGQAKQARETVLYAAIALAGSTVVFALIFFVIKALS